MGLKNPEDGNLKSEPLSDADAADAAYMEEIRLLLVQQRR
jgi:hypothetical protein